MPQFDADLPLATLNGANGFRLDGPAGGSWAGFSVRIGGDVNGDGLDDIIITAPLIGLQANGTGETGSTYVVFGSTTPFTTPVELSSIGGTTGFRIDGTLETGGATVAVSGDINGDGFDDIILSSPDASPDGNHYAGSVFVVFSNPDGSAPVSNLGELDGTNGFRLDGVHPIDITGWSISSPGDINGDGFDDILIGAPFDRTDLHSPGYAYVVFGKAGGFDADIKLADLHAGEGFTMTGLADHDALGFSVSGGGDINGDGRADFLVGAPNSDIGGSQSGTTFVVFGHSHFARNFDLSTLNGHNGFAVVGPDAQGLAGLPVSSGGDINGDGFADIVISQNSQNGSVYVVFGHRGAFDPVVNLGDLDGTNGFRIDGVAGDGAGASLSSAGDINGDGYDDIIIGADGLGAADGQGHHSGGAYVVFGKAGGFDPVIDLSTLNGDNGFRIDGASSRDFAGLSVGGGGDVNGDGFDDIIIGAYGASNNGSTSGSGYVVFGHKPDDAVNVTGTHLANTIHGSDFADTLNGGSGDDTLIAYDGNDTLIAGSGNDTVNAGDGDDTIVMATNFTAADRLDGGAGHDTVTLNGDYWAGVIFDAATIVAVEKLRLGTGHSYDFTTNDGNVAAGATLAVSAVALGSGDRLTFDGAAETDGRFSVVGGAGNDVLTGGAGGDSLHGGAGVNTLTGGLGGDIMVGGGGGANTFVYAGASDSTGLGHDRILAFDADTDHVQTGTTITGIDAAVTGGRLGDAHFDTQLAALIGAGQLAADHAVVLTPGAGPLAGHIFLIVDANGVAGYQAGQDLVIELTGPAHLGDLSAANFI